MNTNNQTALLMQAQEKHQLVNHLIKMKSELNQSKPKDHSHVSQGLMSRRKS